MADEILTSLNKAQCAAVSSPVAVLQILAPPGSGKTKTLTARVAYLLRHHGYKPENVIVATFTVKAAREMKDRLGALLGDGREAKLVLGTFHSIARRYLVRYGRLIDIRPGFGIADTTDSLAIIKRIIKRRKFAMDASRARNRISSLKAKGGRQLEASVGSRKTLATQDFTELYDEYESALKTSNVLDFDDLLLKAVELLTKFPNCVSNVEAVLIDEFQDTNVVQFDLMNLFASRRKRVTIVGDPDQSIYGFRYAEIKNLERMRKQYPETLVILLEENYRSSGAILLAALEVIQQDSSRPTKALLPTHCVGTRPVLRLAPTADDEATWIVREIQRSMAMTGNVLTLNDFAILLRSASLSRLIELALGKFGIPYRMVGGNRFFERVEVKIVIDYLRVISQPDNNDALARIINVPPRRIGDATVKKLLEEAEVKKQTMWSLLRGQVVGTCLLQTKITKPVEKALGCFINLIMTARQKLLSPANRTFSLLNLVEHVLKTLCFQEYLKRSHPDDHDTRWANVEELAAQAADFSDSMHNDVDDDDNEALPVIDGFDEAPPRTMADVLSKFLANLALSSEVHKRTAAADSPRQEEQVTISTIHAAKGLEWPVVFVPGVFDGSIPHSRADDLDEERRLLYVAMTRAQALLYMSCPMENSQRESTIVSPFLSKRSLKPHLDECYHYHYNNDDDDFGSGGGSSDDRPSFTYSTVQSICRILRRVCPPEAHIVHSSRGLLLPALASTTTTTTKTHKARLPRPGRFHNPTRNTANDDHLTPSIDPTTTTNHPHPHKKPRLIGPTTHNTTMTNPASFSIATTTMMGVGFVSARTQLRNMNQNSQNQQQQKRGQLKRSWA